MKLSDAVAKVIDLASTIREYWETELPKRHPDYPIANPGEPEVPPPPEEKKLGRLLGSLPDEFVYQIALLMYLGRGDFGVSELADHYRVVRDNESAAQLASWLPYKATLADYLEDGLAELERNGIEVDRLPLKPTKARK